MELFDIIIGIVGIAAALFAVYTFLDTKKKEAVETQKAAEYQQRLADLLSMTNAVARQGTLLAGLTDRESVTKSEIKHLLIAQLATIESMQSSLARTHAVEQRWQFGVPASYQTIQNSSNQLSPGSANEESAANAQNSV